MSKGEEAKALFLEGYNCSQAVACAFSDEIKMDRALIKKLTTGFGGGVGRMREVCGTISGTAFVISALYNADNKGDIYARIQETVKTFKEENGSIVCRELLGLSKDGTPSPVPEPRTKEYYKKRPCAELVEMQADALEKYIKENPPV